MNRPAARVVLDCDPGHDDAIAILLAAGDPHIDLLGITTVAGNQTLDKTTRNACSVCTIAGITDIPVLAGCDRPLVRRLRTAAEIHGSTGLDGPPPVEPLIAPGDEHAVDFIIRTVMHAPGEVTLVGVGPLTNLAMAVRREPRLVTATQRVVIMGGAYGHGNTTAAAEFNILVDPEAAAIVFDAAWDVTMVGLDVTHKATCTPAVQARIRDLSTPAAGFVDGLVEFYRRTNRQVHHFPDPPIHDPCAVAYVADPSVIDVAACSVAVETSGTYTTGMTVVDFTGPPNPAHHVAVDINTPALWTLIEGSLR